MRIVLCIIFLPNLAENLYGFYSAEQCLVFYTNVAFSGANWAKFLQDKAFQIFTCEGNP